MPHLRAALLAPGARFRSAAR